MIGKTNALSTKRLENMEAEHSRISALMEKTSEALVRNAGAVEVNAILLELSGYTLTHVREEEKLMLECGFPGFEAHKKEHDRLAAYFRGLLDLRSKQEALQCAVNALDLWLDAHVQVTDKAFMDFLNRQEK